MHLLLSTFSLLLCSAICVQSASSSSSSTSSSASTLTTSDAVQPDLREVFHRFIKEYKKNYVSGSSEYRYRFRVFKSALERIRLRNEKRTSPTSALYGITRFSDLSPKEFERKLIFGQFKRSKYSLKAKYLPSSERYKHSDSFYNPKGMAPIHTLTNPKATIDPQVVHSKRLEEQKKANHLQRPDESNNRTFALNQTDRLTRERIEGFKQILADWPDEQFDRELLVKQAKLDVHEHLLNLDQMQRMLDEQAILTVTESDEEFVDNDENISESAVEKKLEDEVDESIISDDRLTMKQKASLMAFQSDQPDTSGDEIDEELDEKIVESIREQLLKQLPTSIPLRKDWREDGVIGQVVDQGACGGCWAISAVNIIETMQAIKTRSHQVQPLSIQQMLDCSSGNFGCEGGDTCNALQWMVNQKIRLGSKSQYPSRRSEAGKCRRSSFPDGVAIASNFTCKDFSSSPIELIELLATHGPVASAVDATSWQDYLGGIIQYNCERRRNHAVQIIGYDLTGPIPYYIVKNSWGPEFGLSGYLHVAIGGNLCDIEKRVSAVDVL